MTPVRITLALTVMAGVAACGPSPITRNAPFEPIPQPAVAAAPQTLGAALQDVPETPSRPAPAARAFKVVDYAVRVPESLRVSEANLYYPIADIVWHGDPRGNRKQQVAEIFHTSLSAAMPEIDGARPVRVELDVNRFHSLTPKTRYSVGGVHSISFFVTVRDADSGQVLVDRRKVKADLNALGGQRAILAESQGLGMKDRIQSHLTRVLRAELTLPGGWAENGRMMTRAIDQI